MNRTLQVAILSALLTMGQGVTLPATAMAQDAAVQAYRIPAGDLDGALRQYAEQTRLQLVYPAELVEGKRSAGLSGSYTPEQALQRLLAGSGLQARAINARTIGLQKAAPAAPRTETAPARSVREEEPIQLESIVVTGSRIRGAEVSAPVLTFTQEEMRLAGQNNLGEMLRALPQNYSGGQNPGVTGDATSGGITNQNLTSGSAFNLRGLGADATLTLLNGARLPHDSAFQAIDVAAIPIGAIDRVEVLLDGASAIYGSDAVGGVVNIILKRDYTGAEVSARFGAATAGDYGQSQYTAVAGSSWDSGGFVVTADLLRNSAARAKHRRYLDHMPGEAEMYPAIDQNSFLFSGYQALGESAEFTLDAYHSDRDGSQLHGSPTSRTRQTTGATSWSVNPALKFAMPHDASLRLHAAFGRSDARYRNDRYNPVTGMPTSFYHENSRNQSMAMGVEVDGRIMTLPGGAVGFSVGGGYRKSTFSSLTLPSSLVVDGENRNYYAYGEIDLPLVSEVQGIAGVRRLSLNGAFRYEHYDSFGETTTPKIGAIWGVAPGLDFKVSWGKSFKAPTLVQQYQGRLLYLYPGSAFAGAPADSTMFLTWGGNPDLDPERAEIISAGVVFKPQFVQNLSFELNWFDIDYRDRVVQPHQIYTSALVDPASADFVTLQPTLAQLLEQFAQADLAPGNFTANNGNPDYSPRPYDPAEVYAIVHHRYVNSARTRMRGVDLSARYATVLNEGALLLTGNGSWITEANRRLNPLAPATPTAGIAYFPARFRGRLGASWSRDGFTISGAANHVSGITNHLIAMPVKGQAMTTADLVLDYQAEFARFGEMGFSLGMTNIFDQRPPYLQPIQAYMASYDSTNYSALGRVVSVTLSKRF